MVLDNSIVLAWCLADEQHPAADRAMRLTTAQGAVVPGIWWYELRNALIVNEWRGRLRAADTQATLADIGFLPISVDRDHDESMLLDLCRLYKLSVYDAAYLEIAARHGLPLASLDRRLCQAAKAAHITLVEEEQGQR